MAEPSPLPVAELVAEIRAGRVSKKDLRALVGAIASWRSRLAAPETMTGAAVEAADPTGGDMESMKAEPAGLPARKLEALWRKYQGFGSGAVDRAAQFAREWADLHSTGNVRLAEDRYVAINMDRYLKSIGA